MDMLLVGSEFGANFRLLDRLRQWGVRCHFASTSQTACELLREARIDVLLIARHLPDGSGLRLIAALSGLEVNAFLSVPVEDSCLWLPVVHCGRTCLGAPALRPAELMREIERLAQQKTDRLAATYQLAGRY
jgi:CheY-like chemotaxis protein